jgi:hypothetical protein
MFEDLEIGEKVSYHFLSNGYPVEAVVVRKTKTQVVINANGYEHKFHLKDGYSVSGDRFSRCYICKLTPQEELNIKKGYVYIMFNRLESFFRSTPSKYITDQNVHTLEDRLKEFLKFTKDLQGGKLSEDLGK